MIDYCDILKNCKSICVVGISEKKYRDSHQIALFLKNAGYNVVGVNPNLNISDLQGIKIFKSFKDINEKIDIVNVFRRSEYIKEIIPEMIYLNPKVIWLQLGIINDDARKAAEKAGIIFIQNRCIKIEYFNCFNF